MDKVSEKVKGFLKVKGKRLRGKVERSIKGKELKAFIVS